MIIEVAIDEKKKEGYTKAVFLYGYMPLLMLIKKYEFAEMYEECSLIHEVITEHNRIFNKNLPTQFSQEVLLEYLKNQVKKNFDESTIINKLGYTMTLIESMIERIKK